MAALTVFRISPLSSRFLGKYLGEECLSRSCSQRCHPQLRIHTRRFHKSPPNPSRVGRFVTRPSVAVALVGVGLGTAYSFMNSWSFVSPATKIPEISVTDSTTKKDGAIITKQQKTELSKPTKRIQGPATNFDFKLTLYQYQTCPFCCKVRAFLQFYGIPFDIVEVNPVLRQQLKFTNYKKVPILLLKNKNGEIEQLNDSSVIISILKTYFLKPDQDIKDILPFYSQTKYKEKDGKEVTEIWNRYNVIYGENPTKQWDPETLKEEKKWRSWVDNVFVHTLSPNVYRSRDEAMQAFNYFSEVGEWEANFAAWERYLVIYVGATAMYFIGKRLKKRYNLKEDVRQSLYDSANDWLKAIGKKQTFNGGSSPNLADLSMFGALSSIEGCIAFKDLLENTKIGPWYYNMKKAVSEHDGYKDLKL